MQVFLETVIYPIANSINDYTMKKKMKTLALVAMSLLTISSFTACDDDWDDEHFSRAVVTLKTEPSTGQPYMQVTDSTVVFPTNLTTAPYGGKEVRAIVDFKFDDNATAHAGRSVTVLRMDTIRTKDMAPSLSDNDKVYGNDPLEAYQLMDHRMGGQLSHLAFPNRIRRKQDTLHQSHSDCQGHSRTEAKRQWRHRWTHQQRSHCLQAQGHQSGRRQPYHPEMEIIQGCQNHQTV